MKTTRTVNAMNPIDTMTIEPRKPYAVVCLENPAYSRTEINPDNYIVNDRKLYQLAIAVVVRGLTTNYTKSGNAKMRELYNDAVAQSHAWDILDRWGVRNNSDAKSCPANLGTNQGYTSGDASDLIQSVALYLVDYLGRNILTAYDGDGRDKTGDKITILRGAFRVLRKEIYGHEQRQYKQVYVDDYESENGAIAVPFKWDIENTEQLDRTQDIIKILDLSDNQRAILYARLRGISLQDIAKDRGVSYQAVQNTLGKIAKKYLSRIGTKAPANLGEYFQD